MPISKAMSTGNKPNELVSVVDYGAVGDGVTDDTAAFQDAAALIETLGGGRLIIPPGTYRVGRQNFAGVTGLGYAYQAEDAVFIENCTKPIVVEGNGAVIKLNDGLKFGSFNPTTGASHTPGALPFTDNNYAASIGYMFGFNNCASVEIRNLELDGNISNVTLGGEWGDTGYQLPAYGMWFKGCDRVVASNIYTHHHALDGALVGYAGLTETSEATPATLINVVSEYNARQGLSWVGGKGLTAIGCKFNHTGKASFTSSPGAGVDIEAESSICRDGLFINCEFENNTGNGMTASAGDNADVAFNRCKFVGQTSWAIWPNMPRFTFTDCSIIGAYVNSYVGTREDATKYVRCLFSDESKYGATLYNIGSLGSQISQTAPQTNVLYDQCTVIATRSRPGRYDSAIVRDCRFEIEGGTDYLADKGFVARFDGGQLHNTEIIENITVNPPANAYYISLTTTAKLVGRNHLDSSTPYIRWWNWSAGAGGYTGYLGEILQEEVPVNALSVTTGRGSHLAGFYGSIEVYAGTAAPTSGTYKQGDKMINSAPSVGNPKGWVCTVAGTPGTWVSEGNL